MQQSYRPFTILGKKIHTDLKFYASNDPFPLSPRVRKHILITRMQKGQKASAGLCHLQFCNLNSFRTKFILCLSFSLGLSIPQFFREHWVTSKYPIVVWCTHIQDGAYSNRLNNSLPRTTYIIIKMQQSYRPFTILGKKIHTDLKFYASNDPFPLSPRVRKHILITRMQKGQKASAGLCHLQFCNLNSFRTKFILCLSFSLGLSIPQFFREHWVTSKSPIVVRCTHIQDG
ncbi:xanthine/uracil permease family protein [Artemisia annua]|uniref:Xanthine/uracil permease family protein n=1 Tax=Artemisia annua TaxID=35608 RepID=A0A2U1N2J6_ARTAN|nr:xanthine/uracil permease family protein [Artemisia annua]